LRLVSYISATTLGLSNVVETICGGGLVL